VAGPRHWILDRDQLRAIELTAKHVRRDGIELITEFHAGENRRPLAWPVGEFSLIEQGPPKRDQLGQNGDM
jgi:hypothetical protein